MLLAAELDPTPWTAWIVLILSVIALVTAVVGWITWVIKRQDKHIATLIDNAVAPVAATQQEMKANQEEMKQGITDAAALMVGAQKQIDTIEHEVTPNKGGSIKDAVKRVETKQKTLSTDVRKLTASVKALEAHHAALPAAPVKKAIVAKKATPVRKAAKKVA
jgi:outer membrane murein-binding lipoprotein Lpp